jgi:uncharacterized protein (DUF58 family)
MTAGRLLDPDFVRELDALGRRFEVRARSGASGEHLAKRRGGSAEFLEHRPYAPGDDLRRIDWAAYARTDEPVLKVHRAEEDVVVRILCDASESMALGAPRKIDFARKIAAATGYLALSRSERAQLFVGADGLRAERSPSRGRGGLAALLRGIDAVETGGTTNLARAIEAVVRRSRRPGLLVVVSDFLDGGPVVDALSSARSAGHDVALVLVLAPEEEHPALEGDLELEDAETGELVTITADADAVAAYEARVAALAASLRAFAKRTGASFVRTRTDERLEAVARRIVLRSID